MLFWDGRTKVTTLSTEVNIYVTVEAPMSQTTTTELGCIRGQAWFPLTRCIQEAKWVGI